MDFVCLDFDFFRRLPKRVGTWLGLTSMMSLFYEARLVYLSTGSLDSPRVYLPIVVGISIYYRLQ
jgi:hypothetical protein